MELLSEEEVKKVASLAKIHLSSDVIKEYQSKLTKILQDVEKIEHLNIDNDIMYTPSSNSNLMDEDVVESMLSLEEVLVNAPNKKGSFIEVGGVSND